MVCLISSSYVCFVAAKDKAAVEVVIRLSFGHSLLAKIIYMLFLCLTFDQNGF